MCALCMLIYRSLCGITCQDARQASDCMRAAPARQTTSKRTARHISWWPRTSTAACPCFGSQATAQAAATFPLTPFADNCPLPPPPPAPWHPHLATGCNVWGCSDRPAPDGLTSDEEWLERGLAACRRTAGLEKVQTLVVPGSGCAVMGHRCRGRGLGLSLLSQCVWGGCGSCVRPHDLAALGQFWGRLGQAVVDTSKMQPQQD